MITETIAAALAADSAVQGLVADYIVLDKLDDGGVPAKAIVLSLIDSTETQTLKGPTDLERARVQLDSWAVDSSDAKLIAKAAREVMSALRGVQADGTEVRKVTRDTKRSRYDPETKLRGVTADYLIWFYE